MVASSPARKGALVARSTVALDFDVVTRTVIRWEDDEKLGFPKSVLIKGQRYFKREEIEAWKEALFREGLKAAVDDRRKRGIPEVAERREHIAGPAASASAGPAASASADPVDASASADPVDA